MSRSSRHRVLPGFRLTLGYTWFYLGLVVLIPLSSLFLKTFSLSWEAFWSTVTTARALAAYRLSFGASLAAALANVVFGLLVAWVLVRYRFPGRDVLESLVDLPFALPTAVAGLTLTTLFSNKGWYGQHLEALGISVAYTSLGVAVALTFIGLPFVVRAVQPVLEELDADVEEAAATLGASPWQTFRRVLFPALVPALLSGFTLAFARALGEYGSVVFISGNMPLRTEIVPLLIITRLEQYDYEGATAIAIVMLAASFSLLLAVNLLHRWSHRRLEARPGA
ncbi:Sulfate transport system permease protein CysT [Myxococcus hansupus]|uniref:Sulfate transport system permease protein CysT n=1 Tax=Pseudomyxococcus hansupus TaxID=1297742 RepID=A0A0H4WUA6_9BACT|nr:sulfate ABC transporter permease subunit CysT [Myxococcus hansupus]AKQ65158.1 Sulfate transport system permease protein CysT [Myxococcus hansupus]